MVYLCMANLNFREDLKLGNEGEYIILDFLIENGCGFIDTNDNNKYDIKVSKNNKEVTYEIKTDYKIAPLFDTGNIFIEFESRGKKSGISVTEADWFVTYLIHFKEAWFIKTNKLKQLISENNFQVFKDAGDINSATHGYLINRKNFKKHFHVFKV
jgi:hypothetical protein